MLNKIFGRWHDERTQSAIEVTSEQRQLAETVAGSAELLASQNAMREKQQLENGVKLSDELKRAESEHPLVRALMGYLCVSKKLHRGNCLL